MSAFHIDITLVIVPVSMMNENYWCHLILTYYENGIVDKKKKEKRIMGPSVMTCVLIKK